MNELLNVLAELDRKRQLDDSENRQIIKSYSIAEIRRLDKSIYSPLEKRYKSLTGMLKEMRKEADPIERMNDIKIQMRMIQTVDKGGFTRLILCADKSKKSRDVMTMLDKIQPLSILYDEFVPIQETFYVNLAYAIKLVSRKVSTQAKEVGVEELVENIKYMDEVTRIVIPTRETAEAVLKKTQGFETGMMSMTRGLFAFAKKINSPEAEKVKLLPTEKALEALQKNTWAYSMKEFDRIYVN